ncbi:class I SAM-dependent methyltransferase [Nonlabens xiamenensis]|uniref:class I SAM-dependent methyltransferase n=1 Tax=Nonlabens xiamenensis TaxID=2341043 RepID=UPI000F614752|nr:class I SAM-dependent methyltransferase [Nonlabens xiamenensis]
MEREEFFSVNKITWNKKARVHLESNFYDQSAFAKAKNSLNYYELNALGDVTGQNLLHLQCHFGQDSLSWAHRGAKVTGIDLSDEAIAIATKLSHELDIPAKFVCCNVLDTSQFISEQFDIVFTSYGVIGWLPDLKPWAQMIAERLCPGGVFYMAEFHPIAWMYDYTSSPPQLKYHYNRHKTIYEEYTGTYADPTSQIVSKEYTWNHGLSTVIQALINVGLSIQHVEEHDGSPYDVFPDMTKRDDGLYYLKDPYYPTIFELSAVKPH